MGGFVARIISPPKPPPPPPAPVSQVVTEAPKGPVSGDVDQYTARKLSSNRRGRRAMILKSTKGVDEDLTLGKKALLS